MPSAHRLETRDGGPCYLLTSCATCAVHTLVLLHSFKENLCRVLNAIMLYLRYGGNLCGSSQRNGKHSAGQRHIKFNQRQLKFNNCHSDSHKREPKASGQSEGSCHSTLQTLKGETSLAARDSQNSKLTLRINLLR